MTFQQAVKAMQKGSLVRRKGWKKYKAVSIINGKRKNTPRRWGLWRRVSYWAGQMNWQRDCYYSYRVTVDDVEADDWEIAEEKWEEYRVPR